MIFADRAPLGGIHRTGAGYLAADARVSRVGIQVYSGHEAGKSDMAQVRILRPDSEVFSHAAMASAAHRPITLDHPSEAVSPANWKTHSVGWTGDTVARDGDFLKIPMLLADQAAIDAVQGGTRELSCGYSCELDWTSGVTPKGEAYDAIQRGIAINHIALVAKGRAGNECRFGDSAASFLRDASGRPRELFDADTGRAINLNEDLISAIVAEAARLGMDVEKYLREVARYTFAASRLGAPGMDTQEREVA